MFYLQVGCTEAPWNLKLGEFKKADTFLKPLASKYAEEGETDIPNTKEDIDAAITSHLSFLTIYSLWLCIYIYI